MTTLNLYSRKQPDPFKDWEKVVFWGVVVYFLLWLLCSCKTRKSVAEFHETTDTLTEVVDKHVEHIDSVAHITQEKDSTVHRHEKRDSVHTHTSASDTLIVKDSTYVQMLADGSRIEQSFHYEYHFKTLLQIVEKSNQSLDYLLEWHEASDSVQQLLSELSLWKDSVRSMRNTMSQYNKEVTRTRSNATTYVLLLLVVFIIAAFIRFKL